MVDRREYMRNFMRRKRGSSARPTLGLTDSERFWFYTRGNAETGCIEWIGVTNPRYGLFSAGGRTNIPAHRFAYEDQVGPIPEGLELDHLCRVKTSVRPSHLEPVTHAANMRRTRSVSNR